jgi:capsular polysaccharide biosynthesis protein
MVGPDCRPPPDALEESRVKPSLPIAVRVQIILGLAVALWLAILLTWLALTS